MRRTEIEWPLINSYKMEYKSGQYEIEPVKTQEMCFDFIVDVAIRTIAVYCYVKNQKKRGREIGWDLTVLYDVKKEQR